MGNKQSTRRDILRTGSLATAIGLAGCTTRILDRGEEDIQDTDGDGVIDSEDYAPRDPEVQRAEQVKGQSTETQTQVQTETEAETDTQERTPTEDIVGENDLVSRWLFRSGFEDLVGDNSITVELGNPTFGTFSGRRAVALDGGVGLMIAQGPNRELSVMSLDGGGASLTGWVYFDQEAGGRPNNDTAVHHILRNDAEYTLAGIPTTGAVELNLNINSQVSGESYSASENTEDELTVPTGEWHHFAYTVIPGDSITFYLDGERRFSDDEMPGHSPNVSAYWSHETVGSWYGTNNPTWYELMIGKLSDMRVYEAELSDEEISQLYANTR
mgnify:FL=1|jgi:hypothetical protein